MSMKQVEQEESEALIEKNLYSAPKIASYGAVGDLVRSFGNSPPSDAFIGSNNES